MEHKGYLLVMMQPPPAFEEEFTAWYDTEHIPERVAVPGFESGVRFVCLSGAPRFLAMYDMQTPQVLESPDYLRVSFDQSSPWTKRVTSRVRVQRAAGVQVYPGDKVTGRAARVLLLRFRALPADAEARLIEGMRENFEGRPELIQWRLLADKTAAGTDYFGFVELRAPIGEHLEVKAFGPHADALDLVNTYAAY